MCAYILVSVLSVVAALGGGAVWWWLPRKKLQRSQAETNDAYLAWKLRASTVPDLKALCHAVLLPYSRHSVGSPTHEFMTSFILLACKADVVHLAHQPGDDSRAAVLDYLRDKKCLHEE